MNALDQMALEISSVLALPELGSKSPISGILEAAQRKHQRSGALDPISNTNTATYWAPDFFNLNRVSIYNEASLQEREAILAGCSNGLLEEAYYIERLGMAFGAKMILLSSSVEEQSLYSLLTEEEAIHLQMISPYVPRSHKGRPKQPFLNFLEQILKDGEMDSLIYLIQVLLEGWGLSHYNALAQSCQEESLAKRLKEIVKDEALHHGAGVAQFNGREDSLKEQSYIFDMLIVLLRMVQSGPQKVVESIEKTKGHLSKAQKITTFLELQCEQTTAKNLEGLTKLILKHCPHKEMDQLKSYGVFRPFTAEECAGVTI